jgi:uncharacterized tellurite resistance protein B-like protein
MNFSDYITDHGKRVNKDYFKNLIQVCKSDGIISPEESKLLHKEGKLFGMTDPEIDRLISEENYSNYNPPYYLEEKFDHLYNVAEIILADGIVTEGERKLLKKYAIEAGISDKAIEILIDILFEGIRNNEDEEALFRKCLKAVLD